MHPTAPVTRLQPRQIRVINARHGMSLRVVQGRFWLTQPNAAQDLFLGPGDVVDLWQDSVVISADTWPAPTMPAAEAFSEYQLQPLVEAQPRAGWLRSVLRSAQRLLKPVAAATQSAQLSGYAR